KCLVMLPVSARSRFAASIMTTMSSSPTTFSSSPLPTRGCTEVISRGTSAGLPSMCRHSQAPNPALLPRNEIPSLTPQQHHIPHPIGNLDILVDESMHNQHMAILRLSHLAIFNRTIARWHNGQISPRLRAGACPEPVERAVRFDHNPAMRPGAPKVIHHDVPG